MANDFRRPMVITNDTTKIEAIPEDDYIHANYLGEYTHSHSIMAEILVSTLSDKISGAAYSQDYPHRDQITDRRIFGSRRVDNLVSAPVEVVGGAWKLGYVHDNAHEDSGIHVAYVYEIPQSAVTNNQLAIDYFRTENLRNGSVKYFYEGTGYYTAPGSSPFRLFVSTKSNGYGVLIPHADPVTPRPEDTVTSAFYVVPRKLKPGEQPRNVITTTDGYVTGEDYFKAISKSPLFA